MCQYLLGAYTGAIQTLSHADGGALTHFYLGKSFLALDRYAEAVTAYDSAHRAGYDAGIVTLAKAEALRYDKRPEEALKLLDSLSGAVEQTAEYLYQRSATVQAMGGSREEVIAYLERAVNVDGSHSGALFGLALENDRHGNDRRPRAVQRRRSSSPSTWARF